MIYISLASISLNTLTSIYIVTKFCNSVIQIQLKLARVVASKECLSCYAFNNISKKKVKQTKLIKYRFLLSC